MLRIRYWPFVALLTLGNALALFAAGVAFGAPPTSAGLAEAAGAALALSPVPALLGIFSFRGRPGYWAATRAPLIAASVLCGFSLIGASEAAGSATVGAAFLAGVVLVWVGGGTATYAAAWLTSPAGPA